MLKMAEVYADLEGAESSYKNVTTYSDTDLREYSTSIERGLSTQAASHFILPMFYQQRSASGSWDHPHVKVLRINQPRPERYIRAISDSLSELKYLQFAQ